MMSSHFIDKNTGMERFYLITLGVHSSMSSIDGIPICAKLGKKNTILHPVFFVHTACALLSTKGTSCLLLHLLILFCFTPLWAFYKMNVIWYFIKPTKLVPYDKQIQITVFIVLKQTEISPVIWASLWNWIIGLVGLW